MDLNPARLVREGKPEWVMLGLNWDGPGVLLLASQTLVSTELDFRARQYDFESWEHFRSAFQPELTLSVHMLDDYIVVAGPTYADCLALLLQRWNPDSSKAVESS